MMNQNKLVLGAVGDIAFDGEIGLKMLEHGADWPFAKVAAQLSQPDILFGNMESVFIPNEYPRDAIDPGGLISLSPAPQAATALKEAGFDFLNIANNHILDAGRIGLEHTIKSLHEAGLKTGGVTNTSAGTRRLVTIERQGYRVGFLCYVEDCNYTLGHTHPCLAYYEPDIVLEDITAYRGNVDFLIVSVHADIEFIPTPSPVRQSEFRRFAKAGATVILGHHPHVPQGIEHIGKSLIAYSLGNFIFNAHSCPYMNEHGPQTAYSYLLLIELTPATGVTSFKRIPFIINDAPDQRPSPLTNSDQEHMLAEFAKLDALLSDDNFVQKTWRDVAQKLLSIYIKRAADMSTDRIIDELVGRLCLVRENRMWLQEIFTMASERWNAQRQFKDELHRPNYQFTRHD